MPKTYSGLGFSMLYPDTWKIDENSEAVSVSLESPEGAFLTIQQIDPTTDPGSAVEEAEMAMCAEYEGVEQEDCTKSIEGVQMTGLTQRFVCLDLIVTSHLLSFNYNGRAYLVQMQAEDRQMERLEIVFDAILTSICKSWQS